MIKEITKEQFNDIMDALVSYSANEMKMANRSQGTKKYSHMDAFKRFSELSIQLSPLGYGDTINIESL